jgi:signal transduction histidine kinase
LKSENKDVIGLLDRIVTIFKMQAEKDDIRLWVEHPQTSFKIKADVALLEIALSNLVENALKFTDPGGEIILTVEEKEGNVRIFVQDTGIGIDQDDLPHVFEPFYRGKSVSVEGSGLGLALVESVIKAHGGKVFVESERGLGSTFTIELPILSEENSQDPSDSVNHELP